MSLPNNKNMSRSRPKKKVVNEIFSKCSEIRNVNPTHLLLLDDFARGVFPKGVKYNKRSNALAMYAGTDGEVTVKLPESPNDLYRTIVKLFFDTENVSVDDDDDDEDTEKHESANVWKKVKPKAMKNQILLSFATELVESRGLSDKKVKNVYNLIQLGFQFKNFTSDDVQYENGKIISIRGLEYDMAKKKFVITNKTKHVPKPEKPPKKPNKLKQEVDAYAREHRNHGTIIV